MFWKRRTAVGTADAGTAPKGGAAGGNSAASMGEIADGASGSLMGASGLSRGPSILRHSRAAQSHGTLSDAYAAPSLSRADSMARGYGAVPAVLRGSLDALAHGGSCGTYGANVSSMSARAVSLSATSAASSAMAESLSAAPRRSLLPLFARAHLVLGDARVVPLMLDGGCVGYVPASRADDLVRMQPRLLRWAEHGRTRVLALRDATREAVAEAVAAIAAQASDALGTSPFVELPGTSPVLVIGGGLAVERRAALLFGLRLGTVSIVAYATSNAGGAAAQRYVLWLGCNRRTAQWQAPLHVAVASGGAALGREALSDLAYGMFGLQPEALRHLRSAGVISVARQQGTGVERVQVQCHELDTTGGACAAPEGRGDVEAYEALGVAQVMDLVRAGRVRDVDVWPLVAFAMRHGAITPDTEPHYLRVAEALAYDLARPFPYP